jgi:hypothetical protein
MKTMHILTVLALAAAASFLAYAETKAPSTYSDPPNEFSILKPATNEFTPELRKDWRHPAPPGVAFLTGGVAQVTTSTNITNITTTITVKP